MANVTQDQVVALSDDILHGADAIAVYLGIERRAVYHAVAKGYLPSFRIGETVCARKTTLVKWIVAQENVSQ